MLEDGFHDELHEIIKHTPRSRQTILVSATMTDNVQKLITLSLTRPVRVFVDPVASTSLKLSQEFIRVRPHREQEKLAFLLALCRRTVLTNAIVFFNLKKTVHEAYLVFQLLGFQVAELHGDLSQPQRVRSLDQFRQREVDFLFATDVASRGLDIPFVKCVINIDMPSTMEIYLHRVGRTARAGRPGRSISLITESDRGLLRTLLSKPTLQMHQRVIRKEVLQKYARKLEKAKTKVPALLEEEKKEKQLNLLEMQLKKADNMIQHKEEIMSRPKRVWFKKETPQTPSTPKSKSRKRRRTKE
ncbi:nucleolar DEAD-box protein required for synthesis of 60S ribosomal subunit [Coelomomyces lativittatus]|nr:nucleolar DEAD-box protein required for synthesis of 60S ribosomal subunit [Coelomomyces lativittatus]